MDNALWVIPALACPLMMVVMMLMMGKGMGGMFGRKAESDEPDPREVQAKDNGSSSDIDGAEHTGADRDDRHVSGGRVADLSSGSQQD